MTASIPRLQLWKEEAAVVSALARGVPEGGTIVEIGTAEGGTARIAYDACRGRGVRIYTVDLAPSRVAVEHLADTDVEVVGASSAEFAARWAAEVGRPIDYLFIDGGHALFHVVNDWNRWVPHLAPGGHVAFHDFDPPHRGGIAHFAVRVCGDTILRQALLDAPRHEYKLLHGVVGRPADVVLSEAALQATLSDIGAQMRTALATAASAVVVDGDAALAGLVALALRDNPADSAARIAWRSPRNGPGGQAVTLDGATLGHLAEQAMTRDYHGTAALVASHGEYLVWGEALQMLAHGWPGPRFPEAVPDPGASLDDLSAFTARIQVRLDLQARLLEAILGWRP